MTLAKRQEIKLRERRLARIALAFVLFLALAYAISLVIAPIGTGS